MYLLAIRSPVEIFKHTQFALFIVVVDRNYLQVFELLAQSSPQDVRLLLAELHVHQLQS